jgi:hypothetical protein
MNKQELTSATEYFHLYLGCEVQTSIGGGVLISVGAHERGEDCMVSIQNNDEESGFYGEWTDYNIEHHKIKLILRPLSSLTEEESLQADKIHFSAHYSKTPHIRIVAEYTKFLLDKHFDLFGLIEAGLALDATTINNQNPSKP